ncbi:MAG: hypothetical protein FD123_4360 [Bacteroidetes bacterium]|nr:MAG: hypothetical protein FD123_4360 [Bacteroidota bacterium]
MIRPILFLATCLLFIIPARAQKNKNPYTPAQNPLAGHWRGWLQQEPIVLSHDFYFEMDLKQDGEKVWGSSYIYVDENYAEMRLTGTFKNGVLTFKEVEFVKEYIRVGFEWCLKYGDLVYTLRDSVAFLESRGVTLGGDAPYSGKCNPARAQLRKPEKKVIAPPPPRIDSTHKDSTGKPVVINSPKPTIKNGKVTKVGDREAKYGHQVTIRGTKIKISVMDNQQVDGDTITMYYNEELVFQHLALKKHTKTFKVDIDPDAEAQVLLLYAENLGEIPPNTAKVTVDDGYSTQTVLLESDLDRCDMIYLKVKKE